MIRKFRGAGRSHILHEFAREGSFFIIPNMLKKKLP